MTFSIYHLQKMFETTSWKLFKCLFHNILWAARPVDNAHHDYYQGLMNPLCLMNINLMVHLQKII